jgi:probable phosphomutase (TIGR03848 family)
MPVLLVVWYHLCYDISNAGGNMTQDRADKVDNDTSEHDGGEETHPKPTILLLVRHALNDWVGDKLAGWTPDVHLNDRGKAQAEALCQRLADEPIAAVYSSPLDRATETANILAAPHQLEVCVRAGLGEVRYGEWTGQSIKELAKDKAWQVVQFYPSGARFPGGEAIREMQARAVAELDELVVKHPAKTILAVSHADVIKAVLAHYAGLHLDLFQRLVVSPASLSTVAFTPLGPRLVCLNDTAHVPPEETHSQEESEDN